MSSAPPSALSLRTTLLWLGGFALLRLLFAATLELMPQEAYYFFYAEHLALSYFDHPPLLAWALWGMSQLFGKTVFTLRATAFLMTAGTLLSLWWLSGRFLSGSRRRLALLLFGVTGLTTVLGLVSTPDVPLLLFWTLSLGCLSLAVFEGQRGMWLLAGLCMGLAFDGKYTGGLLQAGLDAFLILSPQHRRWLRTPWPWLCLLLAQVASLPVYVWNLQHDLASLRFQSQERAAGVGLALQPQFTLGLLLTQAALLTPPLLGALLVRAFQGLRRPQALVQSPRTLFLASFFLPGLLAFGGLSLVMLVKPNWLMPTYVTGILWVAHHAGERLWKWTVGSAAVLHVLAAVQLWLYPVPIRTDDTWVGWEQLAAEVDALWRAHPEAFVFAADDYKTTAELSFYLDRTVYGRNVLGMRGLQYDFVGWDLQALRGRNAIFIDSLPLHDGAHLEPATSPPAALAERFERVRELEPIRIAHRGRTVRVFRVWWAEDYAGP